MPAAYLMKETGFPKDQKDVASSDQERQARGLYGFTFVLAPVLIVYGIIRFTQVDEHNHILQGTFDLAVAAILLVNTWAFRRHRRLSIAKPVPSIVLGVLLLGLLFEGGVSGTAIYWLFSFPPATYLFQGLRKGNVVNGGFLLTFISIAIADAKGIMSTPFTPQEYGQATIALAVVTALGYVMERAQHRFRDDIVTQRERLRTLLEHLPAGVIMVDAETERVVMANKVVEELFGKPIDPQVPLADFPRAYGFTKEDGSEFPEDELPLLRACRKGEPTHHATIAIHRGKEGDTIVRIAALPLRDGHGKVVGAVAVYDDMTKEAEVNRLKSEFISFVSHQLKTPLSNIKWTAEMLINKEVGPLSEEQSAHIERVAESSTHLTRLVGDLLDVSKIESGQGFTGAPKATDVIPLIRAAIRDAQPPAARKQVTIAEQSLPPVAMLYADGSKFREAVTNLVENAVKYSKDGGVVEVKLQPIPECGIAVVVKDNGIGIPEKEKAKVFERFFRASNVPDSTPGTGFGLYIVRQIAESVGGRVWFESESGKGTTFYFCLPPA